jgi:glycosyltransferase involved in cell wall biosynthesis
VRVALAKPDWGITGGFEVVLGRVVADLRQAGHTVVDVSVPVATVPRECFGVPVSDDVWRTAPEWFTHVALLEHFRRLDVSWADLVISTQPPSYAVQHPRHLALFYHHLRAYYDLEDVWVAAGRAPADLHHRAAELLREIDAPALAGVTHFLAGSGRVVERLHHYQGDDVSVGLYEAAAPATRGARSDFGGGALCVSRHEFTKRTELFVQALALCPGVQGTLVGGGGRLPFVQALAAGLDSGAVSPDGLTPEDLWLNLGETDESVGAPPPSARLSIPGRVDDARLAAAYASALCVVAPAYDEDDGLTVFEAMAYGKPVVVCADGGGLTTHVQDGVNGLVVEPTGAALAAAVQRLADDPALARRLGEHGREIASERTPARARSQLLEAVELVCST